METLILTAADLRGVVTEVGLDRLMDELIERLENALLERTATLEVPARDGFSYHSPEPGLLEWMPCHDVLGRVTCKFVGYHPRNPEARGLPTILSTIGCWDATSGHLRVIADGTLLTALRTGAASAIATRLLAREGAVTLGLVGCGAQAVSQLHGLSRVVELRRVLIHDIDPRAASSFAHRVAPLGLHLRPEVVPLDELVREADVISTQTTVEVDHGPVFPDRNLRPWVHVNAVGSDFPGKTEVPVTLLDRALICPDFRAQAIREGECQQVAAERIGPSLADLVCAREKMAHARAEPTVFDSTGWALEDDVALELVLSHAKALGIGARVEIEWASEDPRDPYAGLPPRGTAVEAKQRALDIAPRAASGM